MAEPLLGPDAVAVEWFPDASLYAGRGWVAGPAGTAPLSFAGGVEIDVDVAWPSRLAGLHLQARPDGSFDDRTAGVLEQLLGPAVARELRSLPSREPGRPHVLSERPGTRPIEPGITPALSRVALARLVADDADEHAPLVRAIALLESAAAARRAGGGLGLGRVARGDARAGAELLLASIDDEPLRVDADVAGELAALIRAAADDHVDRDLVRRRLVSVAADLESGRFARLVDVDDPGVGDVGYAAAALPVAMAPMAAGAGRAIRAERPAALVLGVDRRLAPPAFARAPIRATQSGVAEVELSVPGGASLTAGCWARAFAADGSLLALVPFRAHGDDATAVLFVPPAHLRESTLDVTAEPQLRRPTPALLAVESAIAAGRRAAAAERGGRPARQEWESSSRDWRAAGDDDRSSIAQGYAVEGARPESARGVQRVPAPLVVDRL